MNELVQAQKEKPRMLDEYKHLSRVSHKFMQCINCGDCREATDYSSDPQKWGVCVVKDHVSGFEPYFGRGKMQIIRSIWQGKLGLSKDLAETFFQCPTCNSCSFTCFYNVDNAACYEALRAELVDAGFSLDSHTQMNNSILDLLNPYERDNLRKSEWLNKLNFKVKDASVEKADILYFVGCTAGLTEETETVAVNTAKVLKNLEIDFAVLGKAEVCCGSVALRTGDIKTFETAMKKNAKLIKNSGASMILSSCAGCYRTLKVDYANIFNDLGIDVQHTIEFIYKKISDKNLKLRNLGFNVTYHDPCHTGRNSGDKPLYDVPRYILTKITNLNEMKTIKENAKCCGAGGGVKKAFPQLALEIAKSRVLEAKETKSDYIVSICPFCERNLSDAIKALNSEIKVIDIVELLNKVLNEDKMDY